ncbi:MAG: lipase, partial [Actinobacteria bacterium]|nr:lipase [Actinomycetota bacterium]
AVVIAVVVVVVVAGGRNEGIPELNRGGEPLPVILVHGYGGTPSSLATIEQRLRAEGRDVVSVALPDGGTGDILASARVVDEAVRATGSDVVDVIGFSMGGVVARAYVAELGGAAHTRYVMTLASPHHGTKIAGFAVIADPSACTGACEQLAPDSAFLDDLNEPDETPEGPAFVTVWTDKDETVTPPESAELDGALNIRIQDVCPDAPIAHGEVARHPLVLGLIVETLSGRLADVPAPDQCDALTTLGGAA